MNSYRKYWLDLLLKIVTPVLENFNNETLHKNLKISEDRADREKYKGLEILGRTLCGLAPWLETKTSDKEEEKLRVKYAQMARKAIEAATDKISPDFCAFSSGVKAWNEQWLADSSVFCIAIISAPNELYQKLPEQVKQNLVECLRQTRNIRPPFNNWVLFQAIVEVCLYVIGQDYDVVRIDYAIRQLEQWYAGDGFYKDGPNFQYDYYNGTVLNPLIMQIVMIISDNYNERHHLYSRDIPIGKKIRENIERRFKRYVRIQEMSIAPDGSFPPVGRSLLGRCALFTAFSAACLWHKLPEEVTPAMARVALTRVIKKLLDRSDIFDNNGWLKVGICGYQPNLAERYITTASLYNTVIIFLPLGLPDDDDFWTAPDEKTTWEKVFSGENVCADHALENDEKLY